MSKVEIILHFQLKINVHLPSAFENVTNICLLWREYAFTTFITSDNVLLAKLHSHLSSCFSGKEFEGRSSGISIPDSICTDRAMSVISVKSILSNPEKLASTISHMIGHNIGLEHDIDGRFFLSEFSAL